MNKVMLIGRLTKDPEIHYTTGDNAMAIARYNLAVDRRKRSMGSSNEQTADFIGCVAFGKPAEFAEKYLKKGTKIAVTGRIQTGNYVNKNGQKVYTTDVVVEEQEFADTKSSSEPGGMSSNINYVPRKQYTNKFMSIPEGSDEELPFN